MTTPIQQMFHEWKKLREGSHGLSDEGCNAKTDEMTRIEDAMLELPSETAADFAAKVLAYTSYGDLGFSGEGIAQIIREGCELIGEDAPSEHGDGPGGMPWRSLLAAQKRLEMFSEWVGIEAFSGELLDAEGAPTDELMNFVSAEGLSLDWLFTGDVKPLVRTYRRKNSVFDPTAVKERIRLLADVAGIEPVTLEIDDGEVLLTDELMDFCDRANGSLEWLVSGDPEAMVREYCKRERETKQFARDVSTLSDAERSALVFTLKLILSGKDTNDVMQTYTRCVEEQRAA